jgi:Class II flagellar assembly regulator
MRIEWTPPLRAASQRRDERGTVGDRTFTASLGTETAAKVAAPAAAATTAIEGLLALQEIFDEAGGRRRAVARGDKLLDTLDGLRHALLAGVLPRSQIEELGRLAAEAVPLTHDPRLAEILAEIELRAAVELAKLGDLV